MALKPSDWWAISLCSFHHSEQHRVGERSFETKYELDIVELAQKFAQRSPHKQRLNPPLKISETKDNGKD